MIKTLKFGRFLLRARWAFTREQKVILNRRDSDSIKLVWQKVLSGTWKIVEIG